MQLAGARPARTVLLGAALTLLAACGAPGPGSGGDRSADVEDPPAETQEAAMTPPSIEEAQVRLTESVMDADGVVGTMIAECEGEPCIAVLVESLTDELRESIPTEFEGFPVEIRATGEIRALE